MQLIEKAYVLVKYYTRHFIKQTQIKIWKIVLDESYQEEWHFVTMDIYLCTML